MVLNGFLECIMFYVLFVCLLGFNIAIKHLRSCHDGTCSSGTLTPHPVTVYRHRADLSDPRH